MLVIHGLWNGVLAEDPPGTIVKGIGERFGPGALLGAFIGSLVGAVVADKLDSDFAFGWGIAGALVGGAIGAGTNNAAVGMIVAFSATGGAW